VPDGRIDPSERVDGRLINDLNRRAALVGSGYLKRYVLEHIIITLGERLQPVIIALIPVLLLLTPEGARVYLWLLLNRIIHVLGYLQASITG
jgi:hypothetical protein